MVIEHKKPMPTNGHITADNLSSHLYLDGYTRACRANLYPDERHAADVGHLERDDRLGRPGREGFSVDQGDFFSLLEPGNFSGAVRSHESHREGIDRLFVEYQPNSILFEGILYRSVIWNRIEPIVRIVDDQPELAQ